MSEQADPAKTGSIEGLLCPVCRVSLVMSERQGIEIDYCPKCRGVWLDRGELDKIIERSEREMPVAAQQTPTQPDPGAPGAQAQPAPSFLPQGSSPPWGGPAQPQGPQPSAPPYPPYPPQGGPGYYDDPHHGGHRSGHGGHGSSGGHGGFLSRLFR